jgi:hypothetical protein
MIDPPNDEYEGQQDNGKKRVAPDMLGYTPAPSTFINVDDLAMSGG